MYFVCQQSVLGTCTKGKVYPGQIVMMRVLIPPTVLESQPRAQDLPHLIFPNDTGDGWALVQLAAFNVAKEHDLTQALAFARSKLDEHNQREMDRILVGRQ